MKANLQERAPRTPEATVPEHRGRIAETASDVPPGWSYNPSAWSQRAPILVLALTNCAIASYLAACQLGAFRNAWDPFFGNGTMRILHSSVSRAFPVSDAALGAGAYLLEAVSVLIGDTRRWRTKPWMVVTFGILVVPLSLTTLVLLILQPVVVGAWCTLCLVAAAGMLLMVALALDEVIAVLQFLAQCYREGRPLGTTFWHGGSGKTEELPEKGALQCSPAPFRGLTLPWNLGITGALGVWLLVMPAVVPIWSEAAEVTYVLGALALTCSVLALAEVARALRFLNVMIGVGLLIVVPWSLVGASAGARTIEAVVGALLIGLSFPRGNVREHYGSWDHFIV